MSEATSFIGLWRITEMQNFDQDMVEMDGPVLFRIDSEHKGFLEFLGMKVDVSFEMSQRDEKPFAEFTWWEPHRMPHCGRGWITVEGNAMHGEIYFHGGDKSKFKSMRLLAPPDEDAVTALLRHGPITLDPACYPKREDQTVRKPVKQQRSRGPQSPIPYKVRTALKERLEKHIAAKWDHTLVSLILRFRGAYAYVDVLDPIENFPLHLCRLGFLGNLEHWEFAFYKYSDEVYEKSRDWEGSFVTTPEKAFDVAATVYLAGG